MFYWIYDVPMIVAAGFIIGSFVLFNAIGSIILRPFLRLFLRRQDGLDTIIGNFLAFFGVIYGVLIGMLAIATYDNFSTAQKIVSSEAASLAALYLDVSAYPEPERSILMVTLRDYTRFVIDQAWPLQRQGIVPEGGNRFIDTLHATMVGFEPRTAGQEIIHAEALNQFNNFITDRRQRLFSVTTSIPAPMWYTMILGTLLSMALVWLLNVRFIPRLVLGSMLAAALGSVIALVALLDNPFRGKLSIDSGAFNIVYRQVMAPVAEPQPAVAGN